MPPWRRAGIFLTALSVVLPVAAAAQERTGPREVAPYFRALGEHFRVSEREMGVLAAWGLSPEELSVVLFIARRTGGSPDALIAQRRAGLSWHDVARHRGMDASSFHVLIDRDASLGPLAPVYERFTTTPRARWGSIELSDAEIVDLVNVRVLGSVLGMRPGPVLEAAARTGSWVAAYNRLTATGSR